MTAPAIAPAPRPRVTARSGWAVVAGLLLLSALPVVGGLLRLGEVGERHEGAPVLVVASVAHIISMTVYCVLGAFQFSPALRTRRRWHRWAGRALIPAGLVAAVFSVPLGVLFAGAADQQPTALVRVVFAAAMTVFLALGALAIARGHYGTHGAWMTRAYAIAVSGGTQAIVAVLASIVGVQTEGSGETGVVAAGFVVSLIAAELIIARRRARRGAA